MGAQGQRWPWRVLDQGFALADDFEDSDGKAVLTFYEAQDAASRGEEGSAGNAPITLDGALKDYKRDLEARNANPYNAESPRVHLRVSTAEQANGGLSLDQQKQQITGYAMMRGWQVAKFFIEAGVSGSVPLADRPEGQRLLAALQSGDVVVAAKLDRAFRSAADALETLEDLKKDKIGLHLIDLGGDVCGNGISKLVFTILSAVAENERDRIRERVRDAKRHRAEQRLYNGGKRQFGWDVVDGRLVPNATEQAALARARALREERQSLRKIADTLASEFNLKKLNATSVKRILDRA